jgi:hypothetical protein
MRKELPPIIEAGRITTGPFASTTAEGPTGAFAVHGPCGLELVIIAHDGTIDKISGGWEHVSVSTDRRNPNWQEMSWVKNQFWADDECVVQFHPPKYEYVNRHPYCLHLWRHRTKEFPMPPQELV